MTGELSTEQQRAEIDRAEKELVNYVFAKIRTTWGAQKFGSLFNTDFELAEIKREWQRDIIQSLKTRKRGYEDIGEYLKRCRNKIDNAFAQLRQTQNDAPREWDYPDLRKITAYLSNYRNEIKSEPEQQTEQKTDFKKCVVYGCPMAGTLTDSIRGSQNFYCRYHHNKPGDELAQITLRLKNHFREIEFINAVRKFGPVGFMHDLKIPAPDGLQIRDGETWADYVTRLTVFERGILHEN